MKEDQQLLGVIITLVFYIIPYFYLREMDARNKYNGI